jgi:peptidoglycan/xylan/chitin deacetylase (PgdA/CDA1 family)
MHLKRACFLVFILVLFVVVSGCTQAPSASPPVSNTIAVPTSKPNTPVAIGSATGQQSQPQPANQPDQIAVKDGQDGFEAGKPKEEPNVSNSGKSAKLSKLKPIYAVGSGTVAITIDDGPTKYTAELLKVLKENDTKVTFFFLGQNAAAYPASVKEAVYEGHEIGYHSNSHPKMTAMNLIRQEKEYDLGLTKLKKLDSKPVTLFRPPYGAYNNDTKTVTEEHHMQMVLWNEDPKDWMTTNPAAVAKNVLDQVHSGSIIVMHDRPSTIAALHDIIAGIRKKGFKLVVV